MQPSSPTHNLQILDYVEQARNVGKTEAAISAELLASGWSRDDIASALAPAPSPFGADSTVVSGSAKPRRSFRNIVTVGITTVAFLMMLSFLGAASVSKSRLLHNSGEYSNTYYDFHLQLPEGWRLATQFLLSWNSTIPIYNVTPATAEYLVVTQASPNEESQWLSRNPVLIGNFDFAPSRTSFIVPWSKTVDQAKRFYENSRALNAADVQEVQFAGGIGFQAALRPAQATERIVVVVPCESVADVRTQLGEGDKLHSIKLEYVPAQRGYSEPVMAVAKSVRCGEPK